MNRKQVYDKPAAAALKTKDFSGAVMPDTGLGERQIRVTLSTPVPDRVKDVMEPLGCDVSNYKNNPIVLADHDRRQPIGTADVIVKSGAVEAVITFAPAGASTKADEYCALAKAGVLNTVSPGFVEKDVSPLKGGGVHIKSWELLEISLVAVPCNPEAVVTQRSFEPKPSNWKCAASLGLPVRAHDGEEEDILVKAGFTGDEKRDIRFACKGFLAFDSANAGDGASYAIPFAKLIDGRLMVDEVSIKSARAALVKAALPADVAAKAEAVLAHYEAKLTTKNDAPAPLQRQKSLWNISDLASLLAQLRWVYEDSAWEAEYEDDASEVPGMLLTAMQQLGEALIAMTQEEVAELLAAAGGAKAFMAKVKEFRAKSGRTFSAENEKCIKSACEQIKSGHDMLVGMMGADAEDESAEDKSAREARAKAAAKRAREIEILRLKAA